MVAYQPAGSTKPPLQAFGSNNMGNDDNSNKGNAKRKNNKLYLSKDKYCDVVEKLAEQSSPLRHLCLEEGGAGAAQEPPKKRRRSSVSSTQAQQRVERRNSGGAQQQPDSQNAASSTTAATPSFLSRQNSSQQQIRDSDERRSDKNYLRNECWRWCDNLMTEMITKSKDTLQKDKPYPGLLKIQKSLQSNLFFRVGDFALEVKNIWRQGLKAHSPDSKEYQAALDIFRAFEAARAKHGPEDTECIGAPPHLTGVAPSANSIPRKLPRDVDQFKDGTGTIMSDKLQTSLKQAKESDKAELRRRGLQPAAQPSSGSSGIHRSGMTGEASFAPTGMSSTVPSQEATPSGRSDMASSPRIAPAAPMRSVTQTTDAVSQSPSQDDADMSPSKPGSLQRQQSRSNIQRGMPSVLNQFLKGGEKEPTKRRDSIGDKKRKRTQDTPSNIEQEGSAVSAPTGRPSLTKQGSVVSDAAGSLSVDAPPAASGSAPAILKTASNESLGEKDDNVPLTLAVKKQIALQVARIPFDDLKWFGTKLGCSQDKSLVASDGMLEVDAVKISDPLWKELAEFVKQRGTEETKEAAPVWGGIEAPPGAASIKNQDAWAALFEDGTFFHFFCRAVFYVLVMWLWANLWPVTCLLIFFRGS